jgi:hypothetical protein
MRGLPIVGSVRRTTDDVGGQGIELRVLGTPEVLHHMETRLLKDSEDRRLWTWELSKTEKRRSMPHNMNFVILPSTRGATRGVGSDELHDYKTVESGSKSNSSKSNGSK